MITTFIFKNIYILLIALIIILLIISIEIKEYKYQKNGITPIEAIRLINNNNAIIIDFRKEEFFDKEHIINSINIPYSKLSEYKNYLTKYKKNIIIIIEDKKNNYKNILKTLNEHNCYNTAYIINGIDSWIKNNLPTYKK